MPGGKTTFLVVKNRAYSKLAAAISASATTLTVTAGDGAKFPSTYPFHLTIEDEIVECTSRTTDSLTIVRAQQSTSAAAHPNKAYVALNVTEKSITDLNTAVNTIEDEYIHKDGSVAFTGTQTFNAPVVMTSSLNVAGATAFGAPVTMSSSLGVAGASTFGAPVTMSSSLGVAGSLTGAGATFSGGLGVAGLTQLQQTLIYSSLGVAGLASFNAGIFCVGNIAVGGTVDGIDISALDAAVVKKATFDAHTILMAISDNTPVKLDVAASRIIGRKASGNISAMTGAETLALLTGANLDVGNFDVRGQTVTADALTSGRVVFAGASGVLSDDSDFLFATDTLTVTKIAAFEATGLVTSSSTTGYKTTATFVPDSTRTNYAFSIGNRAAELTVDLGNAASQNLELFQMNVNLTASSGAPTSTSTVRMIRVRSTHDTVDMPNLRIMNINTYMDVQKSLQDAYGQMNGIDFYTNAVTIGGEAAVAAFNIDANSAVTGNVRGIIINLHGAGLPSTTSIGLEVRTDGGVATLNEGIRIWSVGGNSINYGLYIDGTINTADIRFSSGATLVDDGTNLTLAGSNLVVPTLTATTITDGTATLTSGEWTGATLNAMVAKGTWTASGTWTIPAVTLNGTLTLNGQTLDAGAVDALIATTGAYKGLKITGTIAGTAGPALLGYHNSSSPAVGDAMFFIYFRGNDSNLNETSYAYLRAVATNVTDGDETGRMDWWVLNNNTLRLVTSYLASGSDGVIVAGGVEGSITATNNGIIRAPNVAEGGAGNVVGANLYIRPGLGTGTGDPGIIYLQGAQQAAAGDNIQTLSTMVEIDENKIGFFGVTPVDKPDTVTDASGCAGDADDKVNLIIDRLQELGLLA